ncbi:MAG: hypothetical protein K2N88_06040 [Muribaculaceae bacterium]|nr:hypothetical protein [Muribaculaceae bacterium]
MKHFLSIILIMTALVTAGRASAADFKVTPLGRALFDAAVYAPSDSAFRPGVAIPDVRLGAKISYGDLDGRVEFSYRFGKLYLADMCLQWNINKNSFLKGGFFIHEFGLQCATGAAHKISMEEPIAQTAFGELRLLGAMYVWENAKFHFAGSLFAQPEASVLHANQLGNTGFGAATRFAWHPVTRPGRIFQIGLSALGQSPDYAGNRKNPVTDFAARYPTRVSDVSLARTSIDSTASIFKFSPELLLAHGRFAAEAQFYYAVVGRRHNLPTFHGTGGYVMGRVLLNRGAKYSYSPSMASLANPPAKSWELVAGYSFVDLNSDHARIFGGFANSANLTLSYYINKYFTWRFNYTYANRRGTHGLEASHANIFQTRIQFVF